jgi:exopolysaccharide/PEP-CTERM locus tyrosine autokinase
VGKIYDALKRAEAEAKSSRRRQSVDDDATAPAVPASGTSNDIGIPAVSVIEPKIAPVRAKAKAAPPLRLMPQEKTPLLKRDRWISLFNTIIGKNNGVIPASADALVTLNEPHSYVAEQYRILKTRILNLCKENNLKTILITSTLAGEGKSTVASNLAISIARSVNEHALLIDCDLRRPTLHKLFNLANQAGLSNYLSEDIPLHQALENTDIEKLTIVPAGTVTDNPSELLSSRKMSDLLAELKNHYHDRYVLLDATPVHQTPEPAILAKQVDCIIFVVRAGNTDRELIKRALDSLVKKKIVGLVFNMARESGQSYYYNYYSSYTEEQR